MLTLILVKAALSAAFIGMLLATLRRVGPSAVGLAAALPVNSVPALFWLSAEQGDTYAASAALGALLGTGLSVVLVLVAMLIGRAARTRLPVHPRRGDGPMGTLMPAAVAGAMSALVMELSRHGGPQLCGLVAAIPVLCMCASYGGYRQGGAPVMLGVLSGYLDGMLLKAAFLVALGAAWAAGAGAWAWPMALAAAGLALLAQRSAARRRIST